MGWPDRHRRAFAVRVFFRAAAGFVIPLKSIRFSARHKNSGF
jgi:hypothetical protein